jgi:hypothetical protein
MAVMFTAYIEETGNVIPFGLLSSDAPINHSEFSNFFKENLNFSELKPFNIEQMVKKYF